MTKIVVVFLTLMIMGCANSRNGNEVARSQGLDFLRSYKACMLYNAEKLAPYNETPDILAQAAHGKCGELFEKFKLATQVYTQSIYPVSHRSTAIYRTESLVADSKQTMRDIFIAKIVELRSKK